MRKFNLKLNSVEKIEELLQELYNETDKSLMEIQEQINKLTSSVQLNNEGIDGKAKFAKAINDFLSNKDKTIGRKLDIAKLMAEVLKQNGNVGAAASVVMDMATDWEQLKEALYAKENEDKEVYSID